jgi:hypothetical protein
MCHVQGKDAIPFLEGLVTGDIAGLADGTGSLSVFTNEKGGIIDDTVITKVRQKGLTWDITGQRDEGEWGRIETTVVFGSDLLWEPVCIQLSLLDVCLHLMHTSQHPLQHKTEQPMSRTI